MDQVETSLIHTFNTIAHSYDQWYDTPEGKDIFHAELECLLPLYKKSPGHWLEIGVGTGRFASMLGITKGTDPSPKMLEVAYSRGIETFEGIAENLPFPGNSFDGILMVLSLCFIANSPKALGECRRVLRPNGSLLLGIVPANSPWGSEYIKKASNGHPVYRLAHFRTTIEIIELTRNAGFSFIDAASTLFWKPGETPQTKPQIATGISNEAGFLALLFATTPPGHINNEKLL